MVPGHLEMLLAEELRNLPEVVEGIGELELLPSSDTAAILERYLPELLRQKYRVWDAEGIDGIFASSAMRKGANVYDISGLCILLSDQALTPFRLILELEDSNAIRSAQVFLGTVGVGPLGISGFNSNSKEGMRQIQTFWCDPSSEWVFKVEKPSVT